MTFGKYLLIALLIAGISPVLAGDATVTVPDSFKATMEQAKAAFERCVGSTSMHLYSDQCAAVANIFTQLTALQLTPVPVPTPTPTPSQTSTPEK